MHEKEGHRSPSVAPDYREGKGKKRDIRVNPRIKRRGRSIQAHTSLQWKENVSERKKERKSPKTPWYVDGKKGDQETGNGEWVRVKSSERHSLETCLGGRDFFVGKVAKPARSSEERNCFQCAYRRHRRVAIGGESHGKRIVVFF